MIKKIFEAQIIQASLENLKRHLKKYKIRYFLCLISNKWKK